MAALALLLVPVPALAHRLRIFAALEDGSVMGYGFFVGGGRPRGAPFFIADPSGARLYEGLTDGDGAFRWPAPAPGDYVVTINAEDGHVASATARGGDAPAAPRAAEPAAAPAADDLDARVAEAVRREILPLREEFAALENRLRLADILSGIFLILGAAGGALWLRDRRRDR
ncbi:MAG: cobalamin biosynthesis protein CbiL [Rhodovulum sulfidophilum]|uniref:Cobalamin biosynthesis protein CbiL n=1 Tax=Rhodovulum sulfidophilum TaxID=35806 RepID=A0A2W5N9N7_RHOSU|nr:MAG: cobalamin biosynthesis protein CbiL [Rhodovulum sulfidophilum]